MSLPVRPGMTVPLPGPLHTHRDKLAELADLGYTDIWSAEADGADAFTPLAMAAAWEPRLRLGTAIVPAYTASPACFAQSVASLADAAPGRFAIGIGSSSNVIVERWNGVPFVEPYKKVRDVVRFLRDALSGEKVAKQYDTFEVQGFRLGIRPEQPPPILVAALREGMLRLAGREADGVIINWLAPTDVPTVTKVVNEAAGGADREIVARIFVCPSENAEVVRAGGQVRHRRLPQRAGVRRVPPLARPQRAAAGHVGRLGGGRPQGGRRGDPRRGRRRPRRPRVAGGLPPAHPAVLRQRRDDEHAWRSWASTRRCRSGTPRASWHPARPERRPVSRGPAAGRRRVDRARWPAARRAGRGSRRCGAAHGGGSPRRGGTAPAPWPRAATSAARSGPGGWCLEVMPSS